MKKKRRLKKWVKVVLGILEFILFSLMILMLFKGISKRYDDLYKQCDESRGYTCSYYDMRQFSIKGE